MWDSLFKCTGLPLLLWTFFISYKKVFSAQSKLSILVYGQQCVGCTAGIADTARRLN